MLRLGITRQQDSLKQLTELAESRDITIVPLPMISISAISFDWPRELEIEKIDWLLFSSASGVNFFLNKLKEKRLKLNSGTKIGAVGNKTQETILAYGIAVDFVPSESYGKTMFNELSERHNLREKTVVYARGATVNFDPAEMLAGLGAKYYPIICYYTKAVSVGRSTITELSSDDFILFTAPSTVSSYYEQFGKPLAKSIAIGKTTAGEMEACGWTAACIMREANVGKVLEYI